MLRHLVKKPQKTEPELILYLRLTVILTSLTLLICATAVLCIRMFNEEPTLSPSLISADSLSAPAIHLGFLYNFTVSCLLYYNYNGSKIASCDDYIISTKKIGDEEYPYVGKFSPKNLNLTGYDDFTEPIFVFLRINITDANVPLIFNDSAQQSSFRMTAYDSGNEYDTMNKDFDDSSVSSFEKSLFYINKHTLSGGYIYKLGFSKKIRKSLIQSPLTYFGYFGFPNYVSKPYIESNIQSVPMSSSNTDDINVRISPRDFIIEEEHEQRNNTIIDVLGSVAAFYSSIVFIYAFLFGVESMKPWGIVHGCCGFKRLEKKNKEKLTKIIDDDLEKRDHLKENDEEERGCMSYVWYILNGSVEEVEEMEEMEEMEEPTLEYLLQRIKYLEEFNRFLKSDVVDISLLREFKRYHQRKQEQQEQRQGPNHNGIMNMLKSNMSRIKNSSQ